MADEKQPYLVVLKKNEQKPFLKWYQWLHAEKQRGAKARLKRCSSVNEIYMQQGFLRLSLVLPRLEKYQLQGLALVAAILALTKEETNETNEKSKKTLPILLGQAKEGTDNPIFSQLRLQRLLASDNENVFLQNMRRAVIQAGEQANPLLLADSILHWQKEYKHPDWFKGSQQWQYRMAKAYYQQVFQYSKEQ